MNVLRFRRQHEVLFPPGSYQSVGVRSIEEVLTSKHRPRVLDLGPARAGTVEFLNRFRPRIQIEDLTHTLLSPAAANDPLRDLSFPDGERTFDLILLWDLVNYLSPDQTKDLSQRIAAVSTPDTVLYAQIWTTPAMPNEPQRIHIADGGTIVHTPRSARTRPAQRITKRRLHELLPEFEFARSFLTRSGMEEYLFVVRAS